jgi:hypothetical protein
MNEQANNAIMKKFRKILNSSNCLPYEAMEKAIAEELEERTFSVAKASEGERCLRKLLGDALLEVAVFEDEKRKPKRRKR